LTAPELNSRSNQLRGARSTSLLPGWTEHAGEDTDSRASTPLTAVGISNGILVHFNFFNYICHFPAFDTCFFFTDRSVGQGDRQFRQEKPEHRTVQLHRRRGVRF
jgi:hypothetical protein